MTTAPVVIVLTQLEIEFSPVMVSSRPAFGFRSIQTQREDTEVLAPATLLSDPFGGLCECAPLGVSDPWFLDGPLERVFADPIPTDLGRRTDFVKTHSPITFTNTRFGRRPSNSP